MQRRKPRHLKDPLSQALLNIKRRGSLKDMKRSTSSPSRVSPSLPETGPGLLVVTRMVSADYLVSAQQDGLGKFDPEHVRSLEIDDELKLGRLLDREVARFCTL
jgi:hypothetical protein